ncbi:hypothetical protein D0Y60_06585 [Shinella sp. WSJ-2]|uniref:glycosyltransferase n=1 Tax=Shinella sp. WSJ-2 TaxID=2303749 RepID=UPI000E3E65F8|nr:glycosyltransferase [Shinella sp. WSJ-2]RFZ88820.1 hypothetical protein D0Y60_06585 [Shinella sp. WSJ-2]
MHNFHSLKSKARRGIKSALKKFYALTKTKEAKPDAPAITKTVKKTTTAAQPAEKLNRLDAFVIERDLSHLRSKLKKIKSPKKELSLPEIEILSEVKFAQFDATIGEKYTPPTSIAFITIANGKFIPGLEGLLLSLIKVYPNFSCDFFVFHDGTISNFAQSCLRQIYHNITFETPDMSWFDQIPSTSGNHKRIGSLGYMNIMALKKDQYQRVILLDSDMLILGDISATWRGLSARDFPTDYVEPNLVLGCYDVGVNPYVPKSPATGRHIINSGVLSLPTRYLGENYYQEIEDLVRKSNRPYCELLDRFADQKIWNQFLSNKDVGILPINFNCNARYVENFLQMETDFVRILHFTGSKPWFRTEYLNRDEIPFSSKGVRATHPIWADNFRKLKQVHRAHVYLQHRKNNPLISIAKKAQIDNVPACVFIGNGPSLAQSDLNLFSGFEKFVFNWFINHPNFDSMQPEHLVLSSHMLFGGWCVQKPALPESFLTQLYEKRWRPKLWISYYFRPYVEAIGLNRDFDVDYILLEKPFKKFIDQCSNPNLDINAFAMDGRTGVLTAALPIAIALGYRRFALVGCDSNYNRTGGSNYFYDSAQHQSMSTREDSLTSTWTEDGRGHFAYVVTQRELLTRQMSFIDFTIDGSLPLPKRALSSLHALQENPV